MGIGVWVSAAAGETRSECRDHEPLTGQAGDRGE